MKPKAITCRDQNASIYLWKDTHQEFTVFYEVINVYAWLSLFKGLLPPSFLEIHFRQRDHRFE
jgi:hypothetical protein